MDTLDLARRFWIADVHPWVAAFDLLPAIYLGLPVDLNKRDGRAMVGHCFCPNLGVMRKGKFGPEMDGGCTAGCDLDESDINRDPATVLSKAAPDRRWRKWGPGVAAGGSSKSDACRRIVAGSIAAHRLSDLGIA
ncbi:hypothetical protein ACLOJK_014790 [Asimina triloba]